MVHTQRVIYTNIISSLFLSCHLWWGWSFHSSVSSLFPSFFHIYLDPFFPFFFPYFFLIIPSFYFLCFILALNNYRNKLYFFNKMLPKCPVEVRSSHYREVLIPYCTFLFSSLKTIPGSLPIIFITTLFPNLLMLSFNRANSYIPLLPFS